MSAIDAAVSALDAAVSALDAAVSAIDAAGRAIDAAVSALDAAVSALDAAVSALDAAVSALDAAVRAIDAAVSAIDAAVSAIDAAVSAIAAAVSAIDAAGRAIDAAGEPLLAWISPLEIGAASLRFPKLEHQLTGGLLTRFTQSIVVFALSVGTASWAYAAGFSREPFLQNPTTSSAVVSFRTDGSCASSVSVAPAGDGEQKVVSDSGGTHHALEVTGLSAGTAYAWQVDACGASASGTLETAPALGTQSVHFVAVGDSGTGAKGQVAVGDAILAVNPELMLHLGDSAYENGTATEVQAKLFAPWKKLLAQVPMYLVLGNHEYNTDQARPTLDSLELPTNSRDGSERYYSFDRGHVHFVALDSNCVKHYQAKPESCLQSEMVAWLENDLAANTQPWTVAFFHHPPWSSGEHKSQQLVRDAFAPVFERYGVDLVLTGHDHEYERSKAMFGNRVAANGERGIPYFVVGTGGAKVKPFSINPAPDWSAARRNDTHGFLDVRVDGGTLNARFISTTGEALDALTLTKEVAPPEEPAPEQPAPEQPAPEQPAPEEPAPDEPAPNQPAPDAVTPLFGGRQSCASAGLGAMGLLVAFAFIRRRR